MPERNDELVFAREAPPQECARQTPWKVLIADDDEEVHHITKLVLPDLAVLGKPVEFISAFSAKEAREILSEHHDIAVILLDVVMEEDDSGLQLVRHIREESRNPLVRIILRTGQPGNAPERKVILDYDINDYKTKTELTAQKLLTTMVSAIRSYRDIITIERNRLGLKKIIMAAPGMFELQSLKAFASGTLVQLASLLNAEENAIYSRPRGLAATQNCGELVVLAGTGEYEDSVDHPLQGLIPPDAFELVKAALGERKSQSAGNRFIGYFESHLVGPNIIFLEDAPQLDRMNLELVDIFCLNLAAAFDNHILNNEIEETQKELIFKLGEFFEERSKESSHHVKRVAEYARLLGMKKGLSSQEVDFLYIASAIHDIGKIAIPDSILNKPGQLDREEIVIMRQHCKYGRDLFESSRRPLFIACSHVAGQHHEQWGGAGYPNGLRGEEIDLNARIASIADVFDALTSDRVYRKAWSVERTVEFFRNERGRQFDPDLVDLFLAGLDGVLAIMQSHQGG